MTDIEIKLIDMGLKVWSKGDKRRIYINIDRLESVFGLIQKGRNGAKESSLGGVAISNNKAFKLTIQDHYYDCITKQFVSPLKPVI
jgi:hypothetical protein